MSSSPVKSGKVKGVWEQEWAWGVQACKLLFKSIHLLLSMQTSNSDNCMQFILHISLTPHWLGPLSGCSPQSGGYLSLRSHTTLRVFCWVSRSSSPPLLTVASPCCLSGGSLSGCSSTRSRKIPSVSCSPILIPRGVSWRRTCMVLGSCPISLSFPLIDCQSSSGESVSGTANCYVLSSPISQENYFLCISDLETTHL